MFFYTGEDILIYFSSYELTLFALMVCISSVVAVNVLEFCVLPTTAKIVLAVNLKFFADFCVH